MRTRAILTTAAMLIVSVAGIGVQPAAAGNGDDRPQRPKPLVHTLSEGAADHANPDAPGIAKKDAPDGDEEGGSAVDSPVFAPGATSVAPDLGIVLTQWNEQGPGPTLGG